MYSHVKHPYFPKIDKHSQFVPIQLAQIPYVLFFYWMEQSSTYIKSLQISRRTSILHNILKV